MILVSLLTVKTVYSCASCIAYLLTCDNPIQGTQVYFGNVTVISPTCCILQMITGICASGLQPNHIILVSKMIGINNDKKKSTRKVKPNEGLIGAFVTEAISLLIVSSFEPFGR